MVWPDFLVTNTNALCLVRDGTARVIEERRAPYFGITWDAERVLVGCDYSNGSDACIAAFDAGTLQPRDEVRFPGRFPHQILWHRGALYVTLPEANQIGSVDLKTGALRIVYYSGGEILPGPVGEDHTNSLWFIVADTKPLRRHLSSGDALVLAHRQSVRFQRPSRIRLVDGTRFTVKREFYAGTAAHNVYYEDGSLFTCDSIGNRLLQLDLRQARVRSVPLGSFARGLARWSGGFLIGLSDEAPRSERQHGTSRVVALDNDLRVTGEFVLPVQGGVHDLRIVNQRDFAHNEIVLSAHAEA